MSAGDWVTWEACLRCGGRAAVGWAPVVPTDGAPAGNHPVEFDCPAGCRVGLDELAPASARRPGRGPLPRTPALTGPDRRQG